MTMTINTLDHITLDGADTGLGVTQSAGGTRVYVRGSTERVPMPCTRYALSCDAPASGGVLGRTQFEADLRLAISMRAMGGGTR